MKEYINKTTGEYRKTSEVVSGEQWIEIPKGADLYGRNKLSGVKEFYKRIQDSHGLATLNSDGVWIKSRYHIGNIDYLWSRAAKPEALPFVDDEPSLNAEIEKVRQSTVADTLAARQATYGSFEDVAFVTEGIMDLIARVRPNGLKDIPIPHRMSLYMIASKIARLANGDIGHKDSWHDIGGYAKLIEDLID